MCVRRRWVLFAGIAALVAPPVASSSITPQARAIVDRYVEATGGAAALEAQRAVHVKGRINTMKLRGGFEQWAQAPGRLVTRMSLGSLKLHTGLDGDVGWRTDLSSKQVTILDGKELERLQSDAYFENEMWARADQGGGRVVHAASAYRNGENYRSIDVTPPLGPPRRLWFNSRTGLLNRVVTRFDQHESDSFLSEYREFAGRRRPTVEAASEEGARIVWDPHEDPEAERVVVDSVWAGTAFDSALFAPPASKQSPLTWLRTKGVARVAFRYGTRHVWIRASINGAPPADFLLDTGASITVIDRGYAEQIGVVAEGSTQVQGMGGAGQASFARAASIRVAGATGDGVVLRDFKIGIVDLGERHESFMWRKMSGLVGYDFLSRFVVELDYDRQLVTFRDPETFVYGGAGQGLDMGLTSGIPTIHATLDSACAGEFLVDVGNSFGVNVHGSLVRDCQMIRAVRGRKQVQVYGGGIGDVFISWLTRLDRMAIGPFEWKEPIAGLSLRTRGMVGSKDLAGNIGNGVLERFKVTFDYARRKLYLEPGKRFAQRDRYSRSGAMLARLKDKVVAAGILHGSAADEAGLKPDDEVTAIDGKAILSFTPEELDRLFVEGEPGSAHTLTVLRKGNPTDLKLILRDVL